ncbi:hypothetical protein [Acidithiobacillus sp.]|uniref:hypothetical protein n=1 Tax=Acidithiobacillus sp. TaxID=1872118 RepID=UPI003CFF3284
MEVPEGNYTISALIDKAHEDRAEPPRPHMGCSMLGHPCDRWLWLSFRWAVVEPFPGRILRLFRRGQNEEATVVSDLRSIGVDVKGTQDRVHFGSHVSGSLDGTATGIPESPKTPHVLEIKTHALKSFEDMCKNGVEKSKPMHWVQMQVYMLGKDLTRALYYAVCKNDDRIYTERVRLDAPVAVAAIARGKRIATDDRMPPPLSTDPSWYECKFCAAHDFCHKTHLTKEVNCRTCAHSTAKPDSTWRCERLDGDDIPVEFQRTGCDAHVLHPDLVPWKMLESPTEWDAMYEIDGKPVANGEPDVCVFGSKEILANPKACASGDHSIAGYREHLGARIDG